MKLIMTLLVRNEEDIIQANIDYHLSQGVDFIIASDNRSEDGTAEILRDYEGKGVLKYIYQAEDDYSQHRWVTGMARMADEEFGADWVINNDADEFWWPLNAPTLKESFAKIPWYSRVVRAERTNFVGLSEYEVGTPFYDRMIYRERESLNNLGTRLREKVAHRGHSRVRVRQGNHKVQGMLTGKIARDTIEIFHFPDRSREQITQKIALGGAAYSRNEQLPPGVGATWRALYEEYRTTGNLDKHCSKVFYSDEQIAKELKSGELLEDERLRDYMRMRSRMSQLIDDQDAGV